jgi:hypothetical protein
MERIGVPMNFAQANSLLQGRCYESRRVGNHVYLRRRNHGIAVQIHSSDKLLFTPDGRVILATKWFSDLAIRNRINGFLPEPWLVCRWRNHKILYRAQDGYKNGWSVDGLVVINLDGTLKCKDRPRRGSLRLMSEVQEEVRELDRERNRPRQKTATKDSVLAKQSQIQVTVQAHGDLYFAGEKRANSFFKNPILWHRAVFPGGRIRNIGFLR